MSPWVDPRWPGPVRTQVLRHLEASYPLEGCGVILASSSAARVLPLRNVSPRPSVAYAFEPHEWLKVCIEAESRGERITAVFHSHVDSPPTFSPEDRAWAVPAGHPLLPGVSYLIASVHRGCVTCVCEYEWSGGEFRTRQV
ncbi:M67 family metallopeptidase [Myxococcus fulvus]|uniref:M67 family metallopeptidase n=1 Tax=Myxococcus TaxID=32 RepID=UPI0031450989